MFFAQTAAGDIMPEAHEQLEQAEHAEHASHSNRNIALVIAIIALFLAFSETLGKSANTEALTLNIKASDTWSFFQAKTIRRTVLQAASEEMKVELASVTDAAAKAAMVKQVEEWEKTAARYRSEPETREGTTELMERAQEAEHERDLALARYHNYEVASAAFQIGIVLCSAAVITGMAILAWFAGGIGVIGIVFMALGLFNPHLLHLG
jgi:ABC-type nickel/cobalt efflux system permease component RcnA